MSQVEVIFYFDPKIQEHANERLTKAEDILSNHGTITGGSYRLLKRGIEEVTLLSKAS